MTDDIERLRKRVSKALIAKEKCIKAIAKATGLKNELLRKKLMVLNERFWILQERLNYYDSTKIAGDEEIEIKRFGNAIENRYSIYLINGEKVGQIDYQGYHSSLIEGDIGYIIDARYRGHNYAYKALCLLSGYLYENGINDFYISAFMDNIPSIRTIKKYGGMVIRQEGRIITFQCLTRKNKTFLHK